VNVHVRDHDHHAPARPPRPVTIDDVARQANVSRQTVSRVLNDKGEIAPATRERIQQVIAELSYRPNLLARGLITRTTHTIGLVVPDISNPFFPEIARGVKDRVRAAGYQMLLSHTAEDPSQEVEALHQFRELRVDGVIVANSRLADEVLIDALTGLDRVVLTNRSLPGRFASIVWRGYSRGARLLTEHLIEGGHRAIGYIDADVPSSAGKQRFLGYRAALEDASIRFDSELLAWRPATGAGGYTAARALLTRARPPTAIVAYNDTMAIGALRACALLGRRVPEDVAVVGFGGAPVGEWVTPSLTTVKVPLYRIGQVAAETLLDTPMHQPPRNRSISVKPLVVVRESSRGAARSSR
jgi:LacI family transcriptional regulator